MSSRSTSRLSSPVDTPSAGTLIGTCKIPKNVNASIAGKASANAPQFVSLKSKISQVQKANGTIKSVEMPPRLIFIWRFKYPSCPSEILHPEIRNKQDDKIKYNRDNHKIDRNNQWMMPSPLNDHQEHCQAQWSDPQWPCICLY